MNVVVFGAGSLGSLIGGLLAREHTVTLVARDPHASAVRDVGLTVGGEFDFRVRPDATTDGTGLRADCAVVTVKAFHTITAAEELATGEFETILSLQNGMGNEEILAEHLDCPVLAGTATYGAVLSEPGHVECTGVGDVVLGAHHGGRSNAADRVGEAFSAAGIETTIAEDMPRRLWEKLAVNAGINPTTALARVENGALLRGDAETIAATAARETAAVARAEGVELTDEDAVGAVTAVATATTANTSSMRQDVEGGKRTEIDAINGYVVTRGREHGIETPVNRTLAGLVKTWEGRKGGS
ncbi:MULTISPECIES: ketopantoate reductase family protein [unclassified Haladaptatus]|uniref:ketopantoate reductase family protein n=1 Tax=unclassified Haladaptatus TaxID=2622732 RepID=UPI00209BE5C5|nr:MULTISPECIES: ketopantoate reductase family protein [unclassified Haladaptatus]MCO8242562.1 ketopantoate reductase family protein [Haladaptatus sp. AB643]MCO8252319.1 ketopantoate reductase family protein [Haladaptatus sp. AB618]